LYFCLKQSRMKKFKSDDLINSLQSDVRQLVTAVESMKGMDKIKLSYPLNNGRWTAIQALEHLNMYNRYYLPAIEAALSEKKTARSAWFNSGTLGNYFTNMMKPTDVYQVKNKMKTAKSYQPPAALNSEKGNGRIYRTPEQVGAPAGYGPQRRYEQHPHSHHHLQIHQTKAGRYLPLPDCPRAAPPDTGPQRHTRAGHSHR
jgi:hypothetical protein